MRVRADAAFCLAVLVLAAPAAGNGRFPRAQRLLEDPSDSAHLILTATYGLLVTNDRGATWKHICEAAYGIADQPLDARASLTPEGALLAGIYSGVARAEGSPCGFERTLGFAEQEAVPDFALAASRLGRAVAIHLSLAPGERPVSQLYQSDDDGRTWQSLGDPMPDIMRMPLTLDIAPSDAERLYISGLGPDGAGVLLRSEDGGASFEAFSIPTNAEDQQFPYIAAVDPHNSDGLYVRTDEWAYDADEQVTNANDALLYSDDGGATFTELLRAGGKIFGFAFSPDSSEVLVGYGDPIQFSVTRMIDKAALGIYRAPKGSSAFAQRYAGAIGCLTWTQQGIYACTMEADTGFSLGLIAGTDFDVATPAKLEPLLRLRDVAGPIECQACTPGDMCLDSWKSTCNSWGRDDCLELESRQCGGGGASGAGSVVGSGGVQPIAEGAGHDMLGARGGCACRQGPRRSGAASAAVTIILGAITLRRRRALRSFSSR